MEHAKHISKLHPALDSGKLKSGSREVQLENQRVELFSKHLTANRPELRAFLSTKLRCREAVEDYLQEVALTVWRKYDHRWDEESF